MSIMLKKLFCIATLAVIVTLSGCQSAQDVSTTTTSTSTTATSTTTTTFTTSTTIAGDNFSVYFIDVGQGDSILIKTKDSHYVLIDSGPSDAGDGVNAFLNSKGVTSLYRMILTHPHIDHYGEFKDVIGNYTISGFMFANYPNTNSTYVSLMNKLATNSIPTIEVKDGDTFTLDNLAFRFYHPPAGFISTSSDENDNSLAIKVSNQSGVDFLDCGDLETAGMSSLLSRHSGDVDIELLKVNHHGSSNGTNQTFLDATTPTDAFICVGAGNPYGHPEAATLNLLTTNGIHTYRTDTNGNISVNVSGGSYSITTAK